MATEESKQFFCWGRPSPCRR